MTWAVGWPEKGWRRVLQRVCLRQRAALSWRLYHSTHLLREAAVSAAPKSRSLGLGRLKEKHARDSFLWGTGSTNPKDTIFPVILFILGGLCCVA